MTRRRSLLLSFILVALPSALPCRGVDALPHSTAVKALFKNPPREYSTGPLWVWNDLLTDQEIRQSLRDLAAQKVKQVWVHPRPGLMTPYLSPEWFRLWRVALREAEKLDMNVWIYDENSYPSGFAGGLVPELMPESRGIGLDLAEIKTAPQWSDTTVAVYQLGGGKCADVSPQVKRGDTMPAGDYLVASKVLAPIRPWNGNRSYVNLLTPGVTKKFLELTMEPYRREIGSQFGKRVPGVFTDEPHIRPANGFPWSDGLAQEFQKRWGYDLMSCLPSLKKPIGDWRKVRHNYYQLLHDQFVERWARPNHDYCASNHLEWTGHYWDHKWPDCSSVPDSMGMYAWHQRPSIDCLMNQYAEHTQSQFGNVRMVRELSSVANQLGAQRTLCEIYGAAGWDLRFEDMKRIGDWLEVLGVNTLNQHLTYVTIRGARKRDHPQSFSYHEPWWDAYHVSAEYFARLSMALSQGEQKNRVLVLEPTTTAWMYQGDKAKLKQLGDWFFDLLMALEAAQVEYDLGDEDIIARYGSVEAHRLKIGNRTYQQVVLPPFIRNLNAATKRLLDQTGMAVTGMLPSRVDGAAMAGKKNVDEAVPEDRDYRRAGIVAELREDQKFEDVFIDRAPGDRGILLHHRRHLADGQLLFLVNTCITNTSSGVVVSRLRGAESWNLYTGERKPFPFAKLDSGISVKFDLPPAGSLLLFLSQQPLEGEFPHENVVTLSPKSQPEARRIQPNVLTLDYVDVTAGGSRLHDAYCYKANLFVWEKHGLERNPWDSAVQFRDELIRKTFPPGSGFEASYRFRIEGPVPRALAIVLERPDLYSITCNGQPVKAKRNQWWLDKSFGRVDLGAAAREGENTVTIKASPLTMFHELEPAYVLGEFALKPAARGFVIVPDTTPGLCQAEGRQGWNSQGHPFYSAGVCYTEQFEIKQREGRFAVALPDWYGSVASVTVNGKAAGYIDAPPWETDVTRWIRRGRNRIEVTVVGTLKNTLGPHHGNPTLGAAWPRSFQNAPESGPPPGTDYSTVAYGLFAPFVVKQKTP